jgi:hypothetical protein
VLQHRPSGRMLFKMRGWYGGVHRKENP